MSRIKYIVVCLDETSAGHFDWVQATRQEFAARADAEAYATTVAKARKPIIVEVDLPTKSDIVAATNPDVPVINLPATECDPDDLKGIPKFLRD